MYSYASKDQFVLARCSACSLETHFDCKKETYDIFFFLNCAKEDRFTFSLAFYGVFRPHGKCQPLKYTHFPFKGLFLLKYSKMY